MDVIGVLEDIAEEVLETTKFFHSGGEPIAYDTEVDLHDERYVDLVRAYFRSHSD